MKHTKSSGFSLIELMIVIVVLGTLTTLAVSSYERYVQKARRTKAKADLLELTQLIERNFTESNRFDQDAAGNAYTLAFTTSPRTGRTFYNLSFPAGQPTATTYIVQAVPTGSQTNDTLCMTLTLNQAGVRTESGTGTVADCW
jgi:type IV pilus assembly protein PilE